VWNLQPHVRLKQMREHKILDNQFLVEEVMQVRGPIVESLLGVQVHEVVFNYLHNVEAVVQQVSKWWE
jgi:hypothetical protein